MRKKNIGPVLADLILINLSLLASLAARFGQAIPPEFLKNLLWLLVFASVVRLIAYTFFGVYRLVWKYISTGDFLSIFFADCFGSALVVTGVFFSRHLGFPRSVVVVDWFLNLLLIAGWRFMPRIISHYRRIPVSGEVTRVLIIGAGDAGVMVAKEMLKHVEAGYKPVGFIDDNPQKHGMRINGIEVLGGRNELPSIISHKKINEVIIAIPSAPATVTRQFVEMCESIGVRFRIVPALHEIITGEININHIKEVDMEDLLGREPVAIDIEKVSSYISGCSIFVTGAAGSIGSELVRQILKFNPGMVVLYDHEENSLFKLENELGKADNLIPVVGDIKDKAKLDVLMERFHPSVIFHAAAYKHVPVMEANVDEAVTNNVFGTKVLAESAMAAKVGRFVMLSTDKAVNPKSVMGATKLLTEMLIKNYRTEPTRFIAVRFGNVLGSRGSVVPIFKEQIAAGGPVTVTHPDIIRYFMTIEEAARLVIQAGAMGKGGEIFVLDMGQPVKISDLAKHLIRFSGFTPDKDIAIKYTGLRPGEKMNEELLSGNEEKNSTNHPKIFIAKLKDAASLKTGAEILRKTLPELEQMVLKMDKEGIIRKLRELLPTYNP